ncbi:MAG: hypothetical protein HY255_05105 [Betaproteobacteria bacterium]|nr:hypothetical protein [Betaproteobacteria bacterium]
MLRNICRGLTVPLRAVLALILLGLAHSVLAYPAHYAVIRQAADGALSLVSLQAVNLSGSAETSSAPLTGTRLQSFLSAELVDSESGAVVHATAADASPWLRGEFHGADTIDGHHLLVEDRYYVIRVPAVSGTRLRVTGIRDSEAIASARQSTSRQGASLQAPAVLEIDLDRVSSEASAVALPSRPSATTASIVLINNGDPANRLDLLIVAEGYTAAQQSLFIQQATTLANAFLSISPYADFRHLINVSWLFVPSNESGADKPDCAETPGQPVVTVDTAFDATFCAGGIRRLVTVSGSKVLTAAAAVPDWDKIMVLVNDSEYGGSGGSFSVATTHPSSTGIMQHEFGHSFSLLADEYSSPAPGYAPCSDAPNFARPCESNVTDQNNRGALKWNRWVAAATPIPTLNPLSDPIAAGLWQGARYLATGMYRQCYQGIMQILGKPFCHVDSEAFVKRLYNGGWGVPATGVSLIEPGASPVSGSPIATPGATLTFAAALAGSKPAAALTAVWLVDGVAALTLPAASGTGLNFPYLVPDAGSHTVELRVTDATPFLLDAPSQSRQWNLGPQPPPAKRGGIDMDADGKGKIVLRNALPQLQAARLVGNVFQFTTLADPGPAYRLIGVGDFDGNGKSDLAFQNTTQGTFGDIKIWKDFSAANEVFWRQVKQVWDVQAFGDLDGDGFGDLVWRYVVSESADTGVSYIWFTNGAAVTQVRKRGGAPLDWKLLGAADLNHDGAADMVYVSPANQARALMATANRTCANLLIGDLPNGYTALKLADFTGRRRGDILLRNATSGQVQLLSLNASGLVLPTYTGAPDDQNASCTASSLVIPGTTMVLPLTQPAWQFWVSADLNGDGITDIVWKQPDGTLTVWLLGADGAAPTVITNAGTVPAGFTVFQP